MLRLINRNFKHITIPTFEQYMHQQTVTAQHTCITSFCLKINAAKCNRQQTDTVYKGTSNCDEIFAISSVLARAFLTTKRFTYKMAVHHHHHFWSRCLYDVRMTTRNTHVDL